MSCKNRIVTSEYVSHGHPDKLADTIADTILQEIYYQDKNARTGIEVMVKDTTGVLGGEVTTTAKIDYETVVRSVFNHVVYPDNHKLTPDNINVINLIGEQSPEISVMVDKENGVIGAGDQGFAVGYASN
jgi:S-adenosylmethionine synthetase